MHCEGCEPRPARFRALAAVVALLASAAGCAPAPDPAATWPAGTLVIARAAALREILTRLQRLEGTPIARRAAAAADRLPDCDWVEGRLTDADPTGVWEQLGCRGAASSLPGLDAARGERDVAFALPDRGDGRIWGTLAVSAAGDVDARVRVPRGAFDRLRSLALPGREAPGPAVLSRSDELVHARLRPEGGLDVASLVAAGGQADRMFRLKSRLFAGAVLDGTWEAAIYAPEAGRTTPRAALAVGFQRAEPAVAAMEQFVSEIEATWPVRRTPFAVGSARGACLLELNLLPDLAPCYVATDAALVVGWSPASVRAALSRDAREAPATPARPEGGITIALDRIAAVDAWLARVVDAAADPPSPRAYPWRRIDADGEREGDAVLVHVRFDAGAGA